MLECVIFDLDGLLVDSEPLQYYAYREAFADFDYELSIDQWVQWHSVEASISRWIESQRLDLDPEAIRARKKVIYEQMIATRLTLKPGAARLVEALATEYRLCVASGSRRESIEACLDRFSLLGHFEHLCSGTEVTRSKPYPDVYLQALQRLGVEPGVTVALEDSPMGMRAALDAGIVCVVCPDGFLPKPKADYADASWYVDSLAEVDPVRLQQLLYERN